MADSEFDPSFLEQADSSHTNVARLEQALRESESLYVSLVETLPVSVLRKDLEGRITFVNNTFCETTNTTAEIVLGKTDFDLYPESLAQKCRSDDEQVLQTGESYDNVEEHKLPDGNVTYVHVFKRPVFNYQGEVVGTEAVFWDVTEEQLAKQAILKGEVRKQAIFERALDCIVFVLKIGLLNLIDQRRRLSVIVAAKWLAKTWLRCLCRQHRETDFVGIWNVTRKAAKLVLSFRSDSNSN